jgi:hypothetical protein
VYRDPELGQRLGQEARAHALAVFAVSEHVRQVQGVYEQLLGRSEGESA